MLILVDFFDLSFEANGYNANLKNTKACRLVNNASLNMFSVGVAFRIRNLPIAD